MNLSTFIYLVLIMCIPFFGYIVKSTEPKKGFSILFSSVISISIFLFINLFSYLGAFFLLIYLILFKRTEKLYYLLLSFISFLVAAFNLVGDSLFIATLPIMLVSSIFSLMMIGHWFLVDPTISRVGMKNIAKSSMFFATMLCLLLITGLITNDISTLYRNIILGLYISSGILSLGAYKSLNETSYTGVMAATGLSYLSLLVSLGGTGTLILLP